jgi:hypothetical protein
LGEFLSQAGEMSTFDNSPFWTFHHGDFVDLSLQFFHSFLYLRWLLSSYYFIPQTLLSSTFFILQTSAAPPASPTASELPTGSSLTMASNLILVRILTIIDQYILINIQITGVSGFIGFKTLILALEAGYFGRAVVRKASQIPKLSNHARVKLYSKNVEFVVITDLSQTGAFDSVLEGVGGILHLSSPLAIEVGQLGSRI